VAPCSGDPALLAVAAFPCRRASTSCSMHSRDSATGFRRSTSPFSVKVPNACGSNNSLSSSESRRRCRFPDTSSIRSAHCALPASLSAVRASKASRTPCWKPWLSGPPVVAARAQGAADELIREGFNGFLAASVDPQDLDETITRAIRSMDQFDRESIMADCRARYGVDASAKRYAEVIAAAARASRTRMAPARRLEERRV